MNQVFVKVYAALWPADQAHLEAVLQVGADALPAEPGQWAELEGGVLRISFEGMYFPLDEVLGALSARLPRPTEGKLDYIDVQAWTLTRCAWGENGLVRHARSLNHVLDYSGH